MIFNCNAEDFLMTCGPYDCIIADPPDNIGLGYAQYRDRMPPDEYIGWLYGIIKGAMFRSGIVWLSYNAIHDFEIKSMVKPMLKGWEGRTFLWTYTFGQNRQTDCGSGYRPILRLSRVGTLWDCESIKVPSWRSEHGDQRAALGGRVPLDVWDFPRVVGNSPERRAWHPTQHPEALYIRMMKMSGAIRPRCFRILDLFGGTGTLLRAAKALRVKNPSIEDDVVERSSAYCSAMSIDSGIRVTEIGQNAPPTLRGA